MSSHYLHNIIIKFIFFLKFNRIRQKATEIAGLYMYIRIPFFHYFLYEISKEREETYREKKTENMKRKT